MMPSDFTSSRVFGSTFSGKDVLPPPLRTCRPWVLSFQRVRKIDPSVSLRDILVLNELYHELMVGGNGGDHPHRFFSGHDGGQSGRLLCPYGIDRLIQRLLQNLSIEKQECVEGLILGGCRYIQFYCKVRRSLGFPNFPSLSGHGFGEKQGSVRSREGNSFPSSASSVSGESCDGSGPREGHRVTDLQLCRGPGSYRSLPRIRRQGFISLSFSEIPSLAKHQLRSCSDRCRNWRTGSSSPAWMEGRSGVGRGRCDGLACLADQR